jgi:hypothetical protein
VTKRPEKKARVKGMSRAPINPAASKSWAEGKGEITKKASSAYFREDLSSNAAFAL